MFFFAFGGPKVREIEATVGGIRVLEIADSGMAAARKISAYGYLTDANPGPVFIGVEKPMKVYTFDNVLFTSAKAPDALIYKIIATLRAEQGRPSPGATRAARILAAGLTRK